MQISGQIVHTYSEPINGAPVLVTIKAADEQRHVIPFERRYWNEFFYAHAQANGHFPANLQVTVEGEDEFNCVMYAEEG